MLPPEGLLLKNSALKVALPEGAPIAIVRYPSPAFPTGNVKAVFPIFAKGPFTKEVTEGAVAVAVEPRVRRLLVVVTSPACKIQRTIYCQWAIQRLLRHQPVNY